MLFIALSSCCLIASADTPLSHLQADALETWVADKEEYLWHKSMIKVKFMLKLQYPLHQWRIDRLHWVIQQLHLQRINKIDE